MNDTDIEGFVMTKDGPIQNVDFDQAVSKDYFTTMGIRLMDGRLFDDRDVQGAPNVAIVNKTMALTFWPHQNPIGRRVRPDKDWCTIIGVVDDVKNAGLDRPAGTELYLPFRQTAAVNAGNHEHVCSAAASGRRPACAGRSGPRTVERVGPDAATGGCAADGRRAFACAGDGRDS